MGFVRFEYVCWSLCVFYEDEILNKSFDVFLCDGLFTKKYWIIFKALDVFSEKTNKTITCEVFHHCKIPCSNQPNCLPIKECKYEWKIGEGTDHTIITNENITIDSEGKNNIIILFVDMYIFFNFNLLKVRVLFFYTCIFRWFYCFLKSLLFVLGFYIYFRRSTFSEY